jgi:uncharacterized protein YjbI with pentapeptide repeats
MAQSIQLAECQFKSILYDKFPYLRCKEEALERGLCLFHDETYLSHSKKNEGTVRERLLTKIDYSMAEKQPLSCIGYHIPDIEVKNRIGFSAPVYFTDAIFHGSATFSNLSFAYSDFSNTTFNGVTFNLVTFSGQTSFFNAKFLGKTLFFISIFMQNVNFNEARFEDVDYVNTRFQKQALFQFSAFERAYFKGATFAGKSDFSYANFYNVRFYIGTEFHLVTNFSYTVFHEKTLFRSVSFQGIILFSYSMFEDQEKTIFDVDNLSNVSFSDTDITRIRFGENAVWGERYGDFTTLDERLLKMSIFPLFNWSKVPGSVKEETKLKRHLRQNYGIEWIEKETNIAKNLFS